MLWIQICSTYFITIHMLKFTYIKSELKLPKTHKNYWHFAFPEMTTTYSCSYKQSNATQLMRALHINVTNKSQLGCLVKVHTHLKFNFIHIFTRLQQAAAPWSHWKGNTPLRLSGLRGMGSLRKIIRVRYMVVNIRVSLQELNVLKVCVLLCMWAQMCTDRCECVLLKGSGILTVMKDTQR